MKPYYSDEQVTLYRGDCREVLAELEDRSVKCVITDPPYSEHTHVNARSNAKSATAGGRTLDGSKAAFESITAPNLAAGLAECGRVSQGWVITNLAYQEAFAYWEQAPEGLRVLRIGVWVKTNPMPQISGDRPAPGWEPIAYMHRSDVKPSWHGGGRAGNYVLPLAQNTGHPTAKPLAMVADWVRLFTDPGDTILDPWAGSGTTGRAALDNGRKAILCEAREDYCELITQRLAQGVLDFGESA